MERIALIGATGVVGESMRRVMEERGLADHFELVPAATARSVGKRVPFGKREYNVVSVEDALESHAQVALFAAGGDTAREWAPRFAEKGITVVDNSSAFRLDPSVPLVIPEVNGKAALHHKGIVANPNCSTIQLIMALGPLHNVWGLKSVQVATYQSVSGSGMKGIMQLREERTGLKVENPAYPHPIDLNCLPHCDTFEENGYTKEELKLLHESRKILGLPDLLLSATAVRVPVWGGHSEAVNAHFEHCVNVTDARRILSLSPGVELQDDPEHAIYPMARYAQGKDEVFVGRVRLDLTDPEHGLMLWVVADNIRKGAATNAVQIVQLLLNQ